MENRKRKSECHIEEIDSKIKSEDLDRNFFFKGDHEIQEAEGEEATLLKYYNGCKKNPGHLNFIPIDTFSVKHLPEGYQDNDLYELIKAVADLTVRVDVKITSPHRPEFWPGTKASYPFYNLRGKSAGKTGTGTVRYVAKYTDGRHEDDVYGGKHWNGNTKCWCSKCTISDHPSSVWWEINVISATHVVFDEIEASQTSLILFYDRDDSPMDFHNKIRVSGIIKLNIEYDRCRLDCVTCDQNIGDKLYRSYKHYNDVWWQVFLKYETLKDRLKMTFIVSHPHGCFKQVSVGLWKNMLKVGKYNKTCTYTASTCPGSSGAHVFCVGFTDSWYHYLVHTGAYKSGLNYSGVGWNYD